jgi:hypothetical protein
MNRAVNRAVNNSNLPYLLIYLQKKLGPKQSQKVGKNKKGKKEERKKGKLLKRKTTPRCTKMHKSQNLTKYGGK